MYARRFRILIVVSLICVARGVLAADPPSSREVADTVSKKWLAGQFHELDAYISSLYGSFPNYAPAILAASFSDSVYKGHLSDAMQKIGQVRQWVEQNPQGVAEGFMMQLDILEWSIQTEINIYTRHGISESQLQPNPAAVRAEWGVDLPAPISILFYFADETTGHLVGTVTINEVLAHSPTGPDWIELYNTTSEDMNIGGWFLSDSDQDDASRRKYEIAAGTIITANGYKVFTENEHFGNSGDPGCHTSFALSRDGETVYLHSGSGGSVTGYVDQGTFGPSADDVSFGRYQRKDASYVFVAMSTSTPGAANSTARVGPVVINEVMYHPAGNDDAEYVELLNISSSAVTLYDSARSEAWRFADSESSPGISYSFPSSTPITLGAGAYLLLVKDLAAFNAENYEGVPAGVTILDWGSGSLDNDGERPQLLMPANILVDRVCYHNVPPWPTTPDGAGQSLQRITAQSYGDDRMNWQAAAPTPGR
jgi:hypothetical protein